MPGQVTARSGNDRKHGRRVRVHIEVRIFACMLLCCLLDILSVFCRNLRLTRYNSVQPCNSATFVLRTAKVTTMRLANRMRLAQGFSKIQYLNSVHPHETEREANFGGFSIKDIHK
jgi:hypothetical protein